MNRNSLIALTLVTLAMGIAPLTGCSDPAEQARAAQLQQHPEFQRVGIFNGCEVTFVNRYYRDSSFYIARCGNTATSTQQFEEVQGKSRVQRTRVSITEELEAIDEQRTKLQEEAKTLEKREAALAKLTPADRAALGIDVENQKSSPPAGN